MLRIWVCRKSMHRGRKDFREKLSRKITEKERKKSFRFLARSLSLREQLRDQTVVCSLLYQTSSERCPAVIGVWSVFDVMQTTYDITRWQHFLFPSSWFPLKISIKPVCRRFVHSREEINEKLAWISNVAALLSWTAVSNKEQLPIITKIFERGERKKGKENATQLEGRKVYSNPLRRGGKAAQLEEKREQLENSRSFR